MIMGPREVKMFEWKMPMYSNLNPSVVPFLYSIEWQELQAGRSGSLGGFEPHSLSLYVMLFFVVVGHGRSYVR